MLGEYYATALLTPLCFTMDNIVHFFLGLP